MTIDISSYLLGVASCALLFALAMLVALTVNVRTHNRPYDEAGIDREGQGGVPRMKSEIRVRSVTFNVIEFTAESDTANDLARFGTVELSRTPHISTHGLYVDLRYDVSEVLDWIGKQYGPESIKDVKIFGWYK